MSPLFAVPPFSKHQEKGFWLGGSRVPGLPWIPPLQLGIWHPANLLGTSSQAHLFVMSLNVAKYHLGKVKMWANAASGLPHLQYVTFGVASRGFTGFQGSLLYMCSVISWSLRIKHFAIANHCGFLHPLLPPSFALDHQGKYCQVSYFHWLFQCDGAG